MASNESKKLLRDVAAAIKIFPKVVARKKRAYRQKAAILKKFEPLSQQLLKREDARLKRGPIHPWRACPAGQHWVSTHPLHVPVSEKNPSGLTTREGYCRTNPSRKDSLFPEEMKKIATEHFHNLEMTPSKMKLGLKNEDDFDAIIAGWTQYWNEVLTPNSPLDPNLVKALISTESDFKPDVMVLASKRNWARGLMQVTDQTLKILGDDKGELKDQLIHIDQDEAFDPNLNIAAGVRWLFHKKSLLEKKLRRIVSWEEAVMEYKAFTKELKQKRPIAIREWTKFLKRYEALKDDR